MLYMFYGFLLLFTQNIVAQQTFNLSTLYISQDIENKTIYNIGVIAPYAPNLTDPRYTPVVDTIVTNDLAIRLAAEAIESKQLLKDVALNITRFYSTIDNTGYTAWETYRMINSDIHAVIGDVTSVLTRASASMTSVWSIPQCSAVSGSFSLSDKTTYPYFFRTVGTSISHMSTLANWIQHMGWEKFTIIYSNDAVGQEVYSNMMDQASAYNLTIINQIPISRDRNRGVDYAFDMLRDSGSRIIILAFSRVREQLRMLKQAKQLGYMSEGWVWIVSDDISMMEFYGDDNMNSFDGLFFINNLWNLTGVPEYDQMYEKWQAQSVPANYSNPSEWNSTSLYYNAAQAYSCVELFALGINKALDGYSGGRGQGLAALSNNTFNSTEMKPSFYNLNYTGPAGKMEFSDSGDLQEGYFQISYLLNGASVPFATVKLNSFEFIPGVDIIYPGNTKKKPQEIAEQIYLNPAFNSSMGIVVTFICSLGIFFCILMITLILVYRNLKPIMISSPVFCYLQLIGITMCYITPLLYLGRPTVALCASRQLLMCVGLVLVVGSIIAKNYRIYKMQVHEPTHLKSLNINRKTRTRYQNIFTVRTSKLKSAYLLRIVAVFELIAITPHIVWNALYSVNVVSYQITDKTYCWYCQYPTAGSGTWGRFNLALVFEMIWLLLLIIFSALIAFKTRGVSSKWSETTQIAYVSYNLGVSAIVMIPSLLLSEDEYSIALYLFVGSLLFGTTFTLIALFVPKFIIICKHIFQKNTQLNLHQVESDDQDHISIHSSNSMDQNIQLKLVAKNMYDFTVEAHEGIIPVKKMAKLDLLSIWTLKRVILVPYKRYFILSSKTGHSAEVYNYTLCEAASTGGGNHYTFRVRTDKGIWFLFQVYDNDSLNRWIDWFNRDPYREKPKKTEEINKSPRPLEPVFTSKSPRLNDLATFGIAPSETSHGHISSNLQSHSALSPSCFSSQSGFNTSSHMNILSSSGNSDTYSSNPDGYARVHELSAMNHQNSFGAINDTARQRYP